jgi:hypothetical protein
MEADYFPYLFLICHFLAMAHVIYNCTMYAFINDRFRRAFCTVVLTKFPILGNCINVGSVLGNSWRGGSSVKQSDLRVINMNRMNNRESVSVAL